MAEIIPLSELALGVPAVVQSMDVEFLVNQRLLALGLAPGSDVKINHIAPLGDPISLSFGAQQVMVRRTDAVKILVKAVAAGTDSAGTDECCCGNDEKSCGNDEKCECHCGNAEKEGK